LLVPGDDARNGVAEVGVAHDVPDLAPPHELLGAGSLGQVALDLLLALPLHPVNQLQDLLTLGVLLLLLLLLLVPGN
jgi:hypothetical protein